MLYSEFFFVQIQTVKNAITCPRRCCSLRDILVACREIGSLPEQVKQKANLRDYNIQSRSSLYFKKANLGSFFLHVINMCGLLQVTSPNMKKECSHGFNDACYSIA